MGEDGTLHRANGGYLILQALDVLLNPFSWEALKRALRSREVAIENIGEQWTPIPAAARCPLALRGVARRVLQRADKGPDRSAFSVVNGAVAGTGLSQQPSRFWAFSAL
jgi:hypothetical protein